MQRDSEHLMDEHIDRHEASIVAELSRLCAQPSVSASGEGIPLAAELVATMLRQRGFDAQVMATPGHPVVLAERSGVSERTLMFYDHYDVQPPEPLAEWITPPFEPTVRDGKLYARGASDNKGHIVGRLAALDAVLAVLGRLPCRVKFVIEGEEEISSPNLPAFVEENAARLAADGCIWESGGVDEEGVPLQVLGMRGICYVELHARSAAHDAHSGTGGSIFPNAAWRLTWALASLKGTDERIRIPGFYDHVRAPSEEDLEFLRALPDPAPHYLQHYGLKGFIKGLRGGLELRREAVFTPTCTICGLTAGYQGRGSKTILPALASAKVDFRLVPDQDPQDIVRKLRAHLAAEGFADIEVVVLGGEAPARTDPKQPLVELASDAARDVYGVPQRIVPITGGSGPIHLFIHRLGLPVVTLGVGYPGGLVHAPNEHVVIVNLLRGAKHAARVIARFGEPL
jgi:acetylornithine deacetylase/succinyl-diaminopimelate desuccinylase-like protein